MVSTSTKWLIVALLGLALWPQAAGAADNDPNQLIKGTWSLFLRGNAATGNTLSVPAGTDLVAVATVTFDGQGNCSSTDQIILDGVFIPSRDEFRTTEARGGDCVYEISPEGYGFFAVTFPEAGATNVTFVLTGRHELHFIASNDSLGIFGGGTMQRASR